MRPSTTTVDPTLTAGPSRAGLEEARPKMKSKRWVRDADEKVMTEIVSSRRRFAWSALLLTCKGRHCQRLLQEMSKRQEELRNS
jgi:hypothetical protein